MGRVYEARGLRAELLCILVVLYPTLVTLLRVFDRPCQSVCEALSTDHALVAFCSSLATFSYTKLMLQAAPLNKITHHSCLTNSNLTWFENKLMCLIGNISNTDKHHNGDNDETIVVIILLEGEKVLSKNSQDVTNCSIKAREL